MAFLKANEEVPIWINGDDPYNESVWKMKRAATDQPTLVRITAVAKRIRGCSRVKELLPQETFIRSHGIAVDPLKRGNCGIDAVGLAVSYLQTNHDASDVETPINSSNNINQLRSDLYEHGRTHSGAFSRHYEGLIKDSGQPAEEWYTKNVLNRLYTPGTDYSSGAATSQYLDGDYGCPIVADFFQVTIYLYDLDRRTTTIYRPNISGHGTRRRTPQVTSVHKPQMEPPMPGSVSIMQHNNHFYWLMPRSVHSSRIDASKDNGIVVIDNDDTHGSGRKDVRATVDEIEIESSSEEEDSNDDDGQDDDGQDDDGQDDDGQDDDGQDDDGQDDEGMSDYEKARLTRIARNNKRIEDLGLSKPSAPKATKKSKAKRKAPSTDTGPSRRSSRLAKSGGGNDASAVRKADLSDSFETDSGDDFGDGPFDDPLDEDEEDKDIENGFFMKKSDDSDEYHDEENDELDELSRRIEEIDVAMEKATNPEEVKKLKRQRRRLRDQRNLKSQMRSEQGREAIRAKQRKQQRRQGDEQQERRREQDRQRHKNMDAKSKERRNKQQAVAERIRYANLSQENKDKRNARRRQLAKEKRERERLAKEGQEEDRSSGAADTAGGKTGFCSNCKSAQTITVHPTGTAVCDECGSELTSDQSGDTSGESSSDTHAMNPSNVLDKNAPATTTTTVTITTTNSSSSAAASNAPGDCRTKELAHAVASSQTKVVFQRTDLGFDVEPSPCLPIGFYVVSSVKRQSEAERKGIKEGDLLYCIGDRRAIFAQKDDVWYCISAQRRPLTLTFLPNDKVHFFSDLHSHISSIRSRDSAPPPSLDTSQNGESGTRSPIATGIDQADDADSPGGDDDRLDGKDLGQGGGGDASSLDMLALSPIAEEGEDAHFDSFAVSDDEGGAPFFDDDGGENFDDESQVPAENDARNCSVSFAELPVTSSVTGDGHDYRNRSVTYAESPSAGNSHCNDESFGYSQVLGQSFLSHYDNNELNGTGADQSFHVPAEYPFSVPLSYLRPIFDNPRKTSAWEAAVSDQHYTDGPKDVIDWTDNNAINEAYPKRKPRKQFGQRNVPQGPLQDLVDPDCDEKTQKNMLCFINFWRSASPEFQQKFFEFLRDKIYKKPTVDNTPLPGSSYEQEVVRKRGGKASHRTVIVSTADNIARIHDHLLESYCGAKMKKSNKRKIGEPASSDAQLVDGTTRRIERTVEREFNKLSSSLKIADGAKVKGKKGSILIHYSNLNVPLLRGGRHLQGAGVEHRQRRTCYHINIQATNKDDAIRLLGKRKIETLSGGNNVLTFNNNACADMREKRKIPKKANSEKTIAGANAVSNAHSQETESKKLFHVDIG